MAKSIKAGKKRVSFRIQADPGSQVHVAGTFNDWNPAKDKLKYTKGLYTGSLMLPKGRHEYKFIVDEVWCVDPQCPEWSPNGLGSLNSVVTVE